MDQQRQQDRKQAIIIAPSSQRVIWATDWNGVLDKSPAGVLSSKPVISRARIFSKSRPFSQSAQTPRIWAN
jgi:hypothetical protein